jgi:hypothetical protein
MFSTILDSILSKLTKIECPSEGTVCISLQKEDESFHYCMSILIVQNHDFDDRLSLIVRTLSLTLEIKLEKKQKG